MPINKEMSLRQLAKVSGVSQPFLSQIKAGKRPIPEKLKIQVEALGAYHLLITDKRYEDSRMASQAGFEPATRCLEGSRSIP